MFSNELLRISHCSVCNEGGIDMIVCQRACRMLSNGRLKISHCSVCNEGGIDMIVRQRGRASCSPEI